MVVAVAVVRVMEVAIDDVVRVIAMGDRVVAAACAVGVGLVVLAAIVRRCAGGRIRPADGEVVLAWGGTSFLPRTECRLPSDAERALLGFVRDALAQVGEVGALPEEGLLVHAASVLDSIGLPPLAASPHPWLERAEASAQSELGREFRGIAIREAMKA